MQALALLREGCWLGCGLAPSETCQMLNNRLVLQGVLPHIVGTFGCSVEARPIPGSHHDRENIGAGCSEEALRLSAEKLASAASRAVDMSFELMAAERNMLCQGCV